MFKIEFPADNTTLALLIGQALVKYGTVTELLADEPAPKGMQDMELKGPGEPEVVEAGKAAEAELAAALGPVDPPAPIHGGGTGEPAESGIDTDAHGVPFNDAFCANAKDPFYGSGKHAGQWKKKRGLDQKEYDAMYTAALLEVPMEAEPDGGAPDTIETSQAFVGQGLKAASSFDTDAPVDAGALMLWVSKQQAAGNLTQADLDGAYERAGVAVTDLFNGTPDELKERSDRLYAELTA